MDHTEEQCEGDEEEEEEEAAMILWEDLPRDLVATIVSWLPIATILRSRAVSKQFHAWLTSVSFLNEIARVPTRSSWLVLFPVSTQFTACAYDPSLGSWLTLPIPLQVLPLASSRGLICAAPRPDQHTGSSSSSEFLVSNLVTRSWVTVPRPRELSRFFFLVVGMISGRAEFKIVVAGSELVSSENSTFKLSAWVFESSSGKWCRGGSVMIDAAISTSKAMSGNKFFVVSGNRELLGYDLDRGSWSRVNLPAAGEISLSSVKLIDRFGRLVLAARTNQDEIAMWELDHDRASVKNIGDGFRNWKELGRMPRCLSDELLRSRKFACVGSGDDAYFASAKCCSILGYTFPTKRWRWIRCCPKVTKNPHYDLLRGICLEPRLETDPGANTKLANVV